MKMVAAIRDVAGNCVRTQSFIFFYCYHVLFQNNHLPRPLNSLASCPENRLIQSLEILEMTASCVTVLQNAFESIRYISLDFLDFQNDPSITSLLFR